MYAVKCATLQNYIHPIHLVLLRDHLSAQNENQALLEKRQFEIIGYRTRGPLYHPNRIFSPNSLHSQNINHFANNAGLAGSQRISCERIPYMEYVRE